MSCSRLCVITARLMTGSSSSSVAAQPGEPAVDGARRATSQPGGLDDRRRTGHEVADREDAVLARAEGVGVDRDVAAVEVEGQRVQRTALRVLRRRAVERLACATSESDPPSTTVRVSVTPTCRLSLRAELAEDVVVRRLAGARDDHVARDRELAARNRLGAAPAGGIRRARGACAGRPCRRRGRPDRRSPRPARRRTRTARPRSASRAAPPRRPPSRPGRGGR